MTDDLREMINDKFASITTIMNMQHEHVQKQLINIEKQSDKMDVGLKELTDAFVVMKLNDANQCLTCPNIRDFRDFIRKHEEEHEKMSERNKDLEFVAKYPKLTISGIVIAVLMVLFGLKESQNNMDMQRGKELENLARTINELKSEIHPTIDSLDK
jgi:hypothetical protein